MGINVGLFYYDMITLEQQEFCFDKKVCYDRKT